VNIIEEIVLRLLRKGEAAAVHPMTHPNHFVRAYVQSTPKLYRICIQPKAQGVVSELF